MINKTKFYNEVRSSLFGGKLLAPQVAGMDYILSCWSASGLRDLRWLAYMLATVLHETARTMQPIEEYGRGRNYKYGRKVKRSGVAYTKPDKIYYGRGYVQLTWYENYELMGRLLNIDLLRYPELALRPDVAARIMFEGMLRGASSFGDFTGKCLEMYFNQTTEDPVNARKIINGLDKAETIAEYYRRFHRALTIK